MARKRVGVIVPSTNTTVETELTRYLPDAMSLHTARMYVPFEGVADSEDQMLDVYLPQATRDIASVRPDVVVFACTSTAASKGSAYEKKLIADLSAATGAPAISIMAAVGDELRRRGARRVGVLTPYPEATNAKIKAGLEEQGFDVPVIAGLPWNGGAAIADIQPEDVEALGKRVLPGHDLDVVFLSCAALYTLDHLDRFSQAFDLPVMSSMSAAVAAIEETLATTAR